MMSVEVKTAGGKFEAGLPKLVFESPHMSGRLGVSADGEKFLMPVSDDQRAFKVVLNWMAAIKR